MQIHLEDGSHEINVLQLGAELSEDGCKLIAISGHGELVIDDLAHGNDYEYRREVWQAMPEGSGATNTYWGDYPGGYEFCRSVKLT